MANSCVLLPEDIMFSCILTRLPVKSIFRFKSVSKRWLHLFSTPDFLKLHHAQFSSDPRNKSVIVCTTRGLNKIYSIDQKKQATRIEHPYGPKSSNVRIVGCCNGLICMVGDGYGDGFVLWNPATRLSKFVPKAIYNSSLGFGYDAEGDDFKVVRISSNGGAEVYSVGSNSWTTIKKDSRFCGFANCDLVVNGNPYFWVVYDNVGFHLALAYFDATKQVFKTVPLPSSFQSPYKLGDLNGSLVFLVWNDSSLDAWAFDESDQSWRKTHSLGPVNEVNVSRFLLFLKNGDIVGERLDGELFVFDPENGCVDEIVIDDAQEQDRDDENMIDDAQEQDSDYEIEIDDDEQYSDNEIDHKYMVYGYTESFARIKGMKHRWKDDVYDD